MIRRLAVVGFLALASCAAYNRMLAQAVHEHGHCEAICDAYSGIPGLTTVFAVDKQTCRCEAAPTQVERKVYGPNQTWSVDIHCKPDCKTFAEKVLKYNEQEALKHP